MATSLKHYQSLSECLALYLNSKINVHVLLFVCRCDCYILKDILENWSDEDASMILQNLHPLLKPNDKVVIIERILHTGRHSEEKVSNNPSMVLVQ